MSDTPRTEANRLSWKRHEEAGVSAEFARGLERELNYAEERNRLLVNAYAKDHEDLCQTAGKALGYPWFKDDQKNCPGATDADGVCVGEHVADTIVEELAKKYEEANRRIKWLISERDTARAQADMKYLLRAELEEMLGTKDPAKGVEVIKAMQERIKRMEVAGDAIAEYDLIPDRLSEAWFEAKEAKP